MFERYMTLLFLFDRDNEGTDVVTSGFVVLHVSTY